MMPLQEMNVTKARQLLATPQFGNPEHILALHLLHRLEEVTAECGGEGELARFCRELKIGIPTLTRDRLDSVLELADLRNRGYWI